MRKRSISSRGMRRKREVLDIDITSVLDILVILLVFLLKNYDSSGVTLNVTKKIRLPVSESREINTNGILVQVSPRTIWVDDKKIISEKSNFSLDAGILSLYNELVQRKEIIENISKVTSNAEKFSGIVNLVFDKSLKYSYMKKIMHTCARAGFRKYKFVVAGDRE